MPRRNLDVSQSALFRFQQRQDAALHMTPQDRNAIHLAMVLAAEQYERDVRTMQDGGDERTAKHFEGMAQTARDIAEAFED